MARNGEGDHGEISQQQPLPLQPRRNGSGMRIRARTDPFLVVCRCFSVITSVSAILCIAVNVWSAVRSFKGRCHIVPRCEYQVFDGIFRCYAILIAFLVVLVETEWGFIVKFSKILEYWAGRGMLQIFVAVMTRALPNYDGEEKELKLERRREELEQLLIVEEIV
ncbi:hypothetical protein SAY86_011808 [Trapa natans]|uniref:Uncharacterized protein n=1 Tax=Trapa natans TaxID=22666 RepID=A0AAN7LYV8_TRANT|nr:hypothetical protein SAY86_011808 [Trapa natans]